MVYVPSDAKWWLADLVIEFQVDGEPNNLVHYNLTLIRADSVEQAYSKALARGREQEASYTNSDGMRVTTRFHGLRDLLVIHDKLADGAELLYEELSGVPQEEIRASIRRKEELSVFETGG